MKKETKRGQCAERIGKKHLRVGLAFDGRELRVTSLWQVEQPVVQLDRLAKDLLVLVDVPGLPPFVEALDDPRRIRGAYRDERGHAYLEEESGILHVSVPFTRLDDLRDVRIRVSDVAGRDLGPRNRQRVTAWFDDPPEKMGSILELGSEALRAHPAWTRIPGTPGRGTPEGRLEIHRDEKGLYRWRLVRFPEDVVAVSGRGYEGREECASDLRWVREHACDARVVPTDLAGGADKSGEPTVAETPSEPGKEGRDEECGDPEQAS